jgi:hypothetical protein
MTNTQQDRSSYLDEEIEILRNAQNLSRKHLFKAKEYGDRRGSGQKTCGKVRFKDREQVKKALFRIREKRRSAILTSTKRMENRYYFCNRCHSWHMTSSKEFFGVEVSIDSVA